MWQVLTAQDSYCLIEGARVPNEFKAIRQAQMAGIGQFVPRVLHHDAKQQILILEWIWGRTLADAGFGLGELAAIMEIVAILHSDGSPTINGIGRPDDHLITLMPRIVTAQLLHSELEKIVARSLAYFESVHVDARLASECIALIDKGMTCLAEKEWPPNETCAVVHGDLKPDNVILTSRGDLRLIDWENGNVTDPLLEISYLIQRFAEQDEDILRYRHFFLRQYLHMSRLPSPSHSTIRFDKLCLVHAVEFFAKALGGQYRGESAINMDYVRRTQGILEQLLSSSAGAPAGA